MRWLPRYVPFVADLDDVRAALDYDTINLYGASYGTRAALTYMRRFPERVRSRHRPPTPANSAVCGYGSHGIRESGYGLSRKGRRKGGGIAGRRALVAVESVPSIGGRRTAWDRP